MGKKLYVGNLSYGVDSSELEQMFAQHGTVQSAEIIIDEGPAIDAALSRATAGDVVLLCVDKPADTWRNLEARRALPVSPGT